MASEASSIIGISVQSGITNQRRALRAVEHGEISARRLERKYRQVVAKISRRGMAAHQRHKRIWQHQIMAKAWRQLAKTSGDWRWQSALAVAWRRRQPWRKPGIASESENWR